MINSLNSLDAKMYSLMDETFSQWVFENLKEKGWSQAELARRSGLTRGAISNIINNYRNRPTPETVKSIARAFGRPDEEVMRIAGYLTPKPTIEVDSEEILYLLRQLDREDIQDVIDYARMRLEKQRDKKAYKKRPSRSESPARSALKGK